MSLISFYHCPVCDRRGHHPECEGQGTDYTGRVFEANQVSAADTMVGLNSYLSSPKQRLLAQLQGLQDDPSDPELNHITADSALLAYIDDPEITEAWNKVKKY